MGYQVVYYVIVRFVERLMFRGNILLELFSKVSVFSTWEKELHKIVFDPRYLLLPSKERKQVYEQYIRERADEERREKSRKLRQRKDDFRQLLLESKIHGRFGTTYEHNSACSIQKNKLLIRNVAPTQSIGQKQIFTETKCYSSKQNSPSFDSTICLSFWLLLEH